jgi:hypothetical protein
MKDTISISGNTGEPGNLLKIKTQIGIEPTTLLVNRLIEEFCYQLASIKEEDLSRVSITLTADLEFIEKD